MSYKKTSELIGPALDWAVASALGLTVEYQPYFITLDPIVRMIDWDDAERYSPSTDWAQGGPIISREHIDLHHCQNGIGRFETLAQIHDCADITCKVIASAWAWHGEGPERDLIAAMRCYVVSKLGDEVDVPKELL